MRTPQIWLLVLTILALAATSGAEDMAHPEETRPAESQGLEVASEPSTIGPEEQLPILGQLPLMDELPLYTPMTPASNAPADGLGGCYIGCYGAAASQSICGPGKIAELLVSGPINNCGIADLRCKTTCFGPVVRCRQFALCFL